MRGRVTKCNNKALNEFIREVREHPERMQVVRGYHLHTIEITDGEHVIAFFAGIHAEVHVGTKRDGKYIFAFGKDIYERPQGWSLINPFGYEGADAFFKFAVGEVLAGLKLADVIEAVDPATLEK